MLQSFSKRYFVSVDVTFNKPTPYFSNHKMSPDYNPDPVRLLVPYLSIGISLEPELYLSTTIELSSSHREPFHPLQVYNR